MVYKCFEVHPLLLGGIQGVFFSLQLGLQARQNLQIAAYLRGKFAYVLAFEFANLLFLVRQSLGGLTPIGFRETLSCLPTVAGALRGSR